MKKLSIVLMALMLCTTVFAQQKQTKLVCERNLTKSTTTLWGQVNDFTTTDINGVEHHLQSYLDQGKHVIIDYSATWCSPCWSLHQSGIFDELWENYGPDGTDELVVLWVEMDNGTTLADIQGTGSSTQGDWTEGGTWPIPIIDDANVTNAVADIPFTGVPTVYMVCPNGAFRDITDEAWENADDVYATLGGCPSATDPIVDFSGGSQGFINVAKEFESTSIPESEITAYNWTLESANPETATGATVSATWTTPGTYDVTLTVTTSAGDFSETKQIYISDGTANDCFVTFEECIGFGDDFTPYNWKTVDGDQLPNWAWQDIDFPNEEAAAGWFVFSLSDATNPGSLTAYEGDKFGCVNAAKQAVNDDWFISPLLSMTATSQISFMARSLTNQYGLEKFTMCVSTTTDDPSSFSVISDGAFVEIPVDFTSFEFDLSAYAGQNVYLAIHSISADASYTMLDNIIVDATPIVNIEDNALANVNVFPNPAKGTFNVHNAENANIKVYNHLGQVVCSENNINRYQNINIENCKAGSYIVSIELNGHITNKHMIITQ